MGSDFSEKVVLVAGGTGGLGRAVSLAFLEQGAQVAVTFRHENEFHALKDAAAKPREPPLGIQCRRHRRATAVNLVTPNRVSHLIASTRS